MIHVHVSAYGDLRRYLPEDRRDMGMPLALPAAATIADMLDALKIPRQSAWLVGVNDDIVDLDGVLKDGDRVELLLPIGGGLQKAQHTSLMR